MNDFLKRLEETIKVFLKENYLPPHRAKTPGWIYHDLDFFSRGTGELSTLFTEERSRIPKNYFNRKEFRSAYLLYFTLINAAKVWHALSQAKRLFGERPLKILDLGSGPATAALAAQDFFADRPIEILSVEQNRNALKDGGALLEKMRPNPRHRYEQLVLDIHPRNLSSLLKGKRWDLCLAANFLSEHSFREQHILCEQILKQTEVLIVVEPALQKVTRQLMHLRDLLVENRWANVYAPCLHQKNCPMLAANQRDWCHFYIHWKCPRLIREVDHIIGNKHDYVKMAYMIFTAKSQIQNPKSQWRVVSSPLISKGKKEFILCGDSGRLQKISRLNKNRGETNLAFDEMKRGDIVFYDTKEIAIKDRF